MRNATNFVPVALLGVGCLLISGIRDQKQVKARAPIPTLSLSVPGFVSHDTVIAADERKIAGMSDYVLRLYQRSADDALGFSVYVGYYDYQVQGKAIHSPKNCLPGAGWEALNASVTPIAVGGATYPVNRYLLSNKGQQALVYYWYQGRGRVEANEYRVKWNLLHDAALYGRTEEALVRIVIPLDAKAVHGESPQAAYDAADALATRVAQELIPGVTRLLPAPASGATS